MHSKAFTIWTRSMGSEVFTSPTGDTAGIHGMGILFRITLPIAASQPSLMIPFGGVPSIYRPERHDGPAD